MKTPGWIYPAAGYNLALAMFHLGFWRLFRVEGGVAETALPEPRGDAGDEQQADLPVSRGGGDPAAVCAGTLTGTALGRSVLGGMAGFWLVRAGLQPVFFAKPAAVRRGFSLIFLLGAGLHALAFGRG